MNLLFQSTRIRVAIGLGKADDEDEVTFVDNTGGHFEITDGGTVETVTARFGFTGTVADGG